MDHTMIIGLGNPDRELEHTYHNVGMLAVAWLADHLPNDGMSADFRSHKELFAYTKIGNHILVHPLVYMNESGRAVKEAMHVFGMAAENLIVIHDDSDLTVGDLKYSSGGGSAGHKGIQSIIDHIKTNDFARIRIGIREKDEIRRKKAEEFVLSPITKKDRELFNGIFETIVRKITS